MMLFSKRGKTATQQELQYCMYYMNERAYTFFAEVLLLLPIYCSVNVISILLLCKNQTAAAAVVVIRLVCLTYTRTGWRLCIFAFFCTCKPSLVEYTSPVSEKENIRKGGHPPPFRPSFTPFCSFLCDVASYTLAVNISLLIQQHLNVYSLPVVLSVWGIFFFTCFFSSPLTSSHLKKPSSLFFSLLI